MGGPLQPNGRQTSVMDIVRILVQRVLDDWAPLRNAFRFQRKTGWPLAAHHYGILQTIETRLTVPAFCSTDSPEFKPGPMWLGAEDSERLGGLALDAAIVELCRFVYGQHGAEAAREAMAAIVTE